MSGARSLVTHVRDEVAGGVTVCWWAAHGLKGTTG
jgi:hypothetical protein